MLNRIVLIGRLTASPELRYTSNGTPVCNFTLACGGIYCDEAYDNYKEIIKGE